MSTPSQLKRLTDDWNTDWPRHTIRCVEILSAGRRPMPILHADHSGSPGQRSSLTHRFTPFRRSKAIEKSPEK
jgi:hypothetical protein